MKAIFDCLRKIGIGRLSRAKRHANKKLSNIATVSDVVEAVGIDSAMTISVDGIRLITSFEDLKLQAYDDGTGIWTIGFGTAVYPNGIRVVKSDYCSLEQAEFFFQHDLNRFQSTVNDAVTVALSQNQFDALVSLTYNIGQTAFKNSTLLKKLNASDYVGAADQFHVWNKGGGKILKGLVRRREVERNLFLKV
ncbi:lysozyme [Acinetobacter sp. C26M]|uniref:lysozyme n=1 Tax=unclassified Acinetobacter TaxID=196816 RepID=UPI00203702D1|nr:MULTISPECIES: lysozyme [unclassified Acinetobacter]USA44984.1 lysozyme [Acinetobacter sp. C26M]USA48487.1 lysozyme [Acinetobacter sp. C26G]